jgi:hypothetical protein
MKRRAFLVAVSFAVLSIPVSAVWTNSSNGLTGSVPAIANLVVDASIGSTLYATTSSGTIFRSSDGGASWKLGGIAGVNVVALDPSSASTVYAGTTTGIFKSTDGGDN